MICQPCVYKAVVSLYCGYSVSQDGVLQPAVLKEVLCQADVLNQIIDVPEGSAVCYITYICVYPCVSVSVSVRVRVLHSILYGVCVCIIIGWYSECHLPGR